MSQKIFEDQLTREETAALLGIKVESLASAISRGFYRFKTYRVGGKAVHRMSEVRRDIERNHAA